LIVAGRQSKGIPIELSQQVHQIIKSSQLEIFDEAGHCPHDERPEKFNQIALRFLSE
jgi:pimeloyl-ACP methyl ester carboxylesterase